MHIIDIFAVVVVVYLVLTGIILNNKNQAYRNIVNIERCADEYERALSEMKSTKMTDAEKSEQQKLRRENNAWCIQELNEQEEWLHQPFYKQIREGPPKPKY